MKLLLTPLVTSLLVGCSSVSSITDVSNLVDYNNHKSVKILEIPADLDSPKFDKTYMTTVSDSVASSARERLDRVPLVDKSMIPVTVESIKVVQKGTQNTLQIEAGSGVVWARANETLKTMGMTVSKSDQSAGTIAARDRSLVSDPASPIGRFLNKSLGKLNSGTEYLFRISGDDKMTTIGVADKAGKALSAEDAELILSRFRKEYASQQ